MSVIIPAYNEKENTRLCAETIGGILTSASVPYEIIFVDDGSADETWKIIRDISLTDPNVRGLRFSRNFGKEGALFAGMKYARGECAAFIDCDLQHPPELLPKMYEHWQNGVEIVEAVKADRGKESIIYKMCAGIFYNIMLGAKVDIKGGSDYKLIGRAPLDELLRFPERLTFFRALSSWVGYEKVKIPFEVRPRAHGTTKWNYPKLIKYAVNNFTSFTAFPLHIITGLGVLFFVFAVALGIHTLYNYFANDSLGGFTTVILILLVTGSLLMIGLGIIGLYIEKIYEEIKGRPRYIVSETTDK